MRKLGEKMLVVKFLDSFTRSMKMPSAVGDFVLIKHLNVSLDC